MAIYGTALLSLCLVVGASLGRWLGHLLGVEADVGGVGIAMLLLVAGCGWLQKTGRMNAMTDSGIAFWSSIYIPIVVAMAASQNVRSALNGGLVPLLAGTLTVAASFVIVGLLVRTVGSGERK